MKIRNHALFSSESIFGARFQRVPTHFRNGSKSDRQCYLHVPGIVDVKICRSFRYITRFNRLVSRVFEKQSKSIDDELSSESIFGARFQRGPTHFETDPIIANAIVDVKICRSFLYTFRESFVPTSFRETIQIQRRCARTTAHHTIEL
jgi:hypothetical protein